MSVDEYLELDRNALDTRYEFIDGVVTMTAGGTADHPRSVSMSLAHYAACYVAANAVSITLIYESGLLSHAMSTRMLLSVVIERIADRSISYKALAL
jgi:hypothetical protein